MPGMNGAGLSGGGLWWDAQVDSSERLVLAFLHAAADAGAVVVNRMEATGILQAATSCTASPRTTSSPAARSRSSAAPWSTPPDAAGTTSAARPAPRGSDPPCPCCAR